MTNKSNTHKTFEEYVKAIIDSLCMPFISNERYIKALNKITKSDMCNRCDGVGYYEGCGDTNCSFYIASKALENSDNIENVLIENATIKSLLKENRRLQQSNCDIRKSRKASDKAMIEYAQKVVRLKLIINEQRLKIRKLKEELKKK